MVAKVNNSQPQTTISTPVKVNNGSKTTPPAPATAPVVSGKPQDEKSA